MPILKLFSLLVCMCGLMTGSEFPWMGVALRPAANMYSSPTEDADVVSQAIYGTTFRILEEKPGWYKVRTPDLYTGWTQETSLILLKDGDPQYASSGSVVEVTSMFASIYREPSITKHQPILTVPFETRLEAAGEEVNQIKWLRVRLPDDRTGYIQAADVTTAGKKLAIPEMIEVGKRFLGIPYLWGGTSSLGFDCSGFTQMLLRRRGILMPRDAQDQADWDRMTVVKEEDLKPGDLLFFGSSDKKITHTGMYIGDGSFINATTNQRPMVQIGNLAEPHWMKLFVAARRPE